MPFDLPPLDLLCDQLSDAVYLIDPDTSNIVWCNRIAYECLGYSQDEILHHSVLSLQKDVVGMPQWSEIRAVIAANDCFTFVGRHATKSGDELSVEVKTKPFNYQGKDYFLSVARDITKRVNLDGGEDSRDRRIGYAINHAMDGLWDWNIETGEVYFSPRLKTMLGYGSDEMKPDISTWESNIHPDDLNRVMRVMDVHLKGLVADYSAQYRLRNRNGHYLWVKDQGRVSHRDEQGNPTHATGMVENITDEKMLQMQLENMAIQDVLTGLPNRREGGLIAFKKINFSQRKALSLCLFVIDFDHFKRVNDVYGHLVGDKAIQFLVKTLASQLRDSDLMYRWGGEEFVVILPDTNAEKASKVSDKLHQSLLDADWSEIGIEPQTISIGGAKFPEAGIDLEVLFAAADSAVRVAKNQGRNQTVFSCDI